MKPDDPASEAGLTALYDCLRELAHSYVQKNTNSAEIIVFYLNKFFNLNIHGTN